jgi:hypothetical protein
MIFFKEFSFIYFKIFATTHRVTAFSEAVQHRPVLGGV